MSIYWDQVNLLSLIFQTLQISENAFNLCILYKLLFFQNLKFRFMQCDFMIWFKYSPQKKIEILYQLYKNNILIKNSSIVTDKYIKTTKETQNVHKHAAT